MIKYLNGSFRNPFAAAAEYFARCAAAEAANFVNVPGNYPRRKGEFSCIPGKHGKTGGL
jgi:hypothetical protein